MNERKRPTQRELVTRCLELGVTQPAEIAFLTGVPPLNASWHKCKLKRARKKPTAH